MDKAKIKIIAIAVGVVLLILASWGIWHLMTTNSVEIISAPEKTEMKIDGKKITGNSIRLKHGKHSIEFNSTGYSAQKHEVEIKPGKPTRIYVKLAPEKSISTKDVSNKDLQVIDIIGQTNEAKSREKIYSEHPVLKKLPYVQRTRIGAKEWSIDPIWDKYGNLYRIDIKSYSCTPGISMIQYKDAGNLLKSTGYDLSKYRFFYWEICDTKDGYERPYSNQFGGKVL